MSGIKNSVSELIVVNYVINAIKGLKIEENSNKNNQTFPAAQHKPQ